MIAMDRNDLLADLPRPLQSFLQLSSAFLSTTAMYILQRHLAVNVDSWPLIMSAAWLRPFADGCSLESDSTKWLNEYRSQGLPSAKCPVITEQVLILAILPPAGISQSDYIFFPQTSSASQVLTFTIAATMRPSPAPGPSTCSLIFLSCARLRSRRPASAGDEAAFSPRNISTAVP